MDKKSVWCTEVLGESLFWPDCLGPGPAGHYFFYAMRTFPESELCLCADVRINPVFFLCGFREWALIREGNHPSQ